MMSAESAEELLPCETPAQAPTLTAPQSLMKNIFSFGYKIAIAGSAMCFLWHLYWVFFVGDPPSTSILASLLWQSGLWLPTIYSFISLIINSQVPQSQAYTERFIQWIFCSATLTLTLGFTAFKFLDTIWKDMKPYDSTTSLNENEYTGCLEDWVQAILGTAGVTSGWLIGMAIIWVASYQPYKITASADLENGSSD